MATNNLDKPEHYRLWFCIQCQRPFAAGESNPVCCARCGSTSNGGFGLPFAAWPDFSRVNIDGRSFLPYTDESDWGNSANKVLQAFAHLMANLQAVAVRLERQVTSESIPFGRLREPRLRLTKAEEYTVRVHFIDDSTHVVPIKPGSLQHVGEEGARRAIALVDGREVTIYNRVEWGFLWEEQMTMNEWLARLVEEKE